MKNIRTDLATERCELKPDYAGSTEINTLKIGNVLLEKTFIKDSETAKRLNLQKGKYLSISFDDPFLKSDIDDIKSSIGHSLSELFDVFPKNVLIIGLGNRQVTPDSLGPITCERIRATRHLAKDPLFTLFCSKNCKISVLNTDVSSNTGIDSTETVKALVKEINPDAIIIIDALAARRPTRICKTIQLTDTGITPASGYDGNRPAIDRKLLGIPVIGIGIPTVVDSRSYRTDFGIDNEDDGLVLTPIDIGKQITKCAEILSEGINDFFGTNI